MDDNYGQTVPMPQESLPEPCPFCGTIPNSIRMELDECSSLHRVVCHYRECLAEGPVVGPHKEWSAGREEAIRLWNSRVIFGAAATPGAGSQML
ncbi:MAG: hypothetical protein EBW87_00685 [Burkholderiaceae bacterium]|nr:hypothetical protein [Burkholderiaceae bacterium]